MKKKFVFLQNLFIFISEDLDRLLNISCGNAFDKGAKTIMLSFNSIKMASMISGMVVCLISSGVLIRLFGKTTDVGIDYQRGPQNTSGHHSSRRRAASFQYRTCCPHV